MSSNLIELIGYLASALIVVSLLMGSVLRLRIVNLVGALVFTAYGLLIASFPVVAANGAIVLINVWHLRRLLTGRAGSSSYFEVVEVPHDSPLLRRFVAFYRDDIHRHQPDAPEPGPDHRALVVLHDGIPAGVVLAREANRDTVVIDLDYVIEAHRDLRPGIHLFDESGVFGDRTRLVTTGVTRAHARYLSRLGFAPDGDRWVRSGRPTANA